MLKKTYFLLIPILTLNVALKADEATATEPREELVEEIAVEEVVASSEEEVVAAATEVSQSELIEIVGYLTAQGGGVPMLKLDEAGIAALASGLEEGLIGEKTFDDFSQESIQDAFGQAQARAEALQVDAGSVEENTETADAGTEEAEADLAQSDAEKIPEISEDALRIIGFIMTGQSGLTQLGFGAQDASLIKKGFIAGSSATEPDPIIQARMPAFQEFIQARVAAAQADAAAEAEALAAEQIAAGEAFFEELAADADVQKSDSGLRYKIIEPGSEPKPTLEDKVLVHYKGTLIDGTQFDSSYDRGDPAEFPLNGVVPGFGEGLTKVGAGGKIILYIPSKLGYGNSPRPGGTIKPGDTLIFECELIEVNPK